MFQKKSIRGFTLMETLLAMMIISALVVAMGYILILGMNSYRLVVDRRGSLQQARLAVNMMTSELMDIQDPATDISAVSSAAITFTNAQSESVTYQFSGSTLTRNSSTLATNVEAGSGFSYFTQNSASTADPAQIYRVNIVLGIESDDPHSGTVVARDAVYLRNRYYNTFTRN